jgi:probable phosphoglycerate mutase
VIRHASAWKNVPPAQRPRAMSEAELDSLTPDGLVMAEKIGAKLAGKDVAAVVTSPANRARQTGAAIAGALGLEATASDAFRTLDTGPDRAAASGTARARSWKAGRDPRPPGGESLADGFARASAALEQLRRQYAGRGAVAVVTHGEIAASLLAKAAGQDIVRGYFDHYPGEGALHEIAIDADGAWRAVRPARRSAPAPAGP